MLNKYSHFLLFCSMLLISITNGSQIYDSFSGEPMTLAEYERHKKDNTSFWCTIDVKPCNFYEGRRADGTCNHLKAPYRGARHTPMFNVLPLHFHNDIETRISQNGDDLPLSRTVRTTLLSEGRVPSEQFNLLVTYFLMFMSSDILSAHDTYNYLVWRPYCCEERGKKDPQCAPIKIPDNDPVHRFTNERCMNLTRPWTFQSIGCVKDKRSTPKRIVSPTTFFDLSQIYTDEYRDMKDQGKLLKGGLLKYELEDGRIWPPSSNNSGDCLLNKKPEETRCHNMGDGSSNSVLGTNLVSIWMWRHHNFIASELARVNPCWSSQKLFYTAKDINIAIAVQILYYELYPILLGKENLYSEKVLSPHPGYRDVYNEDVIPQVSIEYGFVLRWAHTIQEGIVKFYDSDGNYIKSQRIVDLSLRTGYLARENHIDYLTQGAFRQPAAKIDNIVDPDIAQKALGDLQRVTDLTTNDLEKNRYYGLAPYIKYRKFCFGEIIKTFDDLKQAIDPEKVELLKELYKHVEDIDLIAGVWVEKPIFGGRVPATFYCLVVNQLIRTMLSDRHWYERPNRPNAFTLDQLIEIRKATIARLMCNVGDKVTKIQPNAFLIPNPGNEIRNCDTIANINFNAWRDSQCYNNYLGPWK